MPRRLFRTVGVTRTGYLGNSWLASDADHVVFPDNPKASTYCDNTTEGYHR
ncbi:hypothetical protein [Nocardia sp. CA-135398]|uniref:hypothetical protein n=1 Tax=Nocardia sp. CA-135398 TaxID=3239977 RepID=UPI003D95DDE8